MSPGKLIRGGGSAARISNELRPPDPGGGDVWLTTSRAETFALPVDPCGHGSGCEENVRFPPTQGLVEQPVFRQAGSRSTQQSDGQHSEVVKVSAILVDVTPEPVEEPVPTGPTGDDGDNDYMSPMVWQAASGDGLSMKEEVVPDLAGGVTIGVTSLADAGVASLADAGVASLADAGVASLADLAEVVSSADLARNVTVDVTSLADPVDVVTDGVTFREKCGVLDGSVCDSDDYCDDTPGYWDDDEPGDFGGCPDVMLLADPVSVLTDGMTFQERCDVLNGSVYDYDDYCDEPGVWVY